MWGGACKKNNEANECAGCCCCCVQVAGKKSIYFKHYLTLLFSTNESIKDSIVVFLRFRKNRLERAIYVIIVYIVVAPSRRRCRCRCSLGIIQMPNNCWAFSLVRTTTTKKMKA